MKDLRRVILPAIAGNALAFYNFTLYIFLAPVLAPLFFPSDDHVISVISTLGVFAVSFLMRPVGAILFGHIGDKYGRKKALSVSIIAMAIPAALIGTLPSYQYIGILAPTLIIILRLLQGLCTGGEYNGAGVFVVENVQVQKAGFAGSILTSSSIIGSTLGIGTSIIVTQPFMPDWSWRLAFLAGAFISFIVFYIRQKVQENPHVESAIKKGREECMSLSSTIYKLKSSVLSTIGIAGFSGIMFYMMLSYTSVFLTIFLKWSHYKSLSITLLGMVSYIVFTLISGFMADKYSEKKVMISGAIATALLIYPGMLLLTSARLIGIISAQVLFSLLAAWFQGPMNLFMARLFPVAFRYRGVAISYCVGMAIFGGTTSAILTSLVKVTGNYLSPSIYLIGGALMGLLAVIAAKPIDKNTLIGPVLGLTKRAAIPNPGS